MIYIGFDFSVCKPACTVIYKDEIIFFCWPKKISKATHSKLINANVNVTCSNLVSTSNITCNSEIMRIEIQNAKSLATLICDTLSFYLNQDDDILIAQEGFSYGSSGSSILELAGFKYILMDYLSKYIPIENMYTYSPMTVKKYAGCSKKGSTKVDMINAFTEKSMNSILKNKLLKTPMELKNKINFIDCIDDIVDSYWVTMTMCDEINNKQM